MKASLRYPLEFFLSWFSLTTPLIAWELCVWSLSWSHGMPAGNIFLTRRYAFLASAIFGVYVLIVDAREKRRRLLWLPIVSLVLTVLFYFATKRMTYIL